jgi:hypothetical protein
MATLPSYVKIIWPETAEQHASVVLRSEVERGIPRTRRTAADALVTVSLTLQLFTPQRVADFEAWFYADALAGAAWFSFTHPRTGATLQGRMVGGFGPLRQTGSQTWSMPVVIEYIRPSFVQLAPGLHDVDASRILSVQRNSTATYIDDAGVLQTAAANVARWQGGQVLVEGEATNLVLQSQAVNLSPWSGGARTLAAEFWAGNVPFFKVAKATTAASEGIRSGSAAATAGGAWTMTLALLADSRDTCTVGIFANIAEGAGGYWGEVAECSKEIISGPGIFSAYSAVVGSLWHVDNLSATVPTLIRITRSLGLSSAVTSLSCMVYPGRASSTTIGDAVKMTRVQLEPSDSASSYVPTTTAAVTRAADIITVAA